MSKIALLLALVLLAGCQISRYEPQDEPNATGYSSQRISDRRFSVMFEGTPETGFQRVKDLALLRAAELTREAGATHFRVIADRSRVKERTRTIVGQSTTDEAAAHIAGANTAPLIVRLGYPVAWLEVEIYADAQAAGPDQTGVRNAAETIASLAKQYHLSLPAGPRE